MTDDELEQILRQVIEKQDYQVRPARPEDAQRLLQEAKRQHIIGRWEGYGYNTLTTGTRLTLPSKPERPLVLPRDMTVKTAMHLTLERAGEDELTGDGELDVEVTALSGEVVKTVYVDITGKLLADGGVRLTLQNIEADTPRLSMEGSLTDPDRTLKGNYETVGLLTEGRVRGEFSLEKPPERPADGDAELIIFEPKRTLIDLLKHARRSILVTHFTTEIHSEEYISVMLEKLAEGVSVERIVAFLPDAPPEAYSWLKRFRYRDGTSLPYYTEYQFSGAPLPSDIMIVDDVVTVQYFATYPDPSRFGFAICHYDPRIALHFREYIKALIPAKITLLPVGFYR